MLQLTLEELEGLANGHEQHYSCYPRMTKSGKERWIERPKAPLRVVQKRIVSLLGRVQHPTYLHSAYRGRSYVTNASQHRHDQPTGKIDIKKFFPSARRKWVARAFRDQFHCALDVAAILAKLTTFNEHIPTGGNSSTMVSFWAYKPMFDEISDLAERIGAVMTCCVDDMTFTGESVTRKFINEVACVVRRYGLRTHKVHYFPAGTAKTVTGVVITSKGPKLPNKRRLLLHDAFQTAMTAANPDLKVRAAQSLLGRSTEAEQVEARFRSAVVRSTRILNDAKREARASSAGVLVRR